MLSTVRVVSQADYEKWLSKLSVKKADTSLGLKVLEKNGCIACHSLDGSKVVGPSFKGLAGSTRSVMTNGTKREVKADEAYIKSSIDNPDADVVDGFSAGLMKSYTKMISAEEIQQINDYLKSLK